MSFNAISCINIYNWDAGDIDDTNEPYIVAIWKVKKLKAQHTTPVTDMSFNDLTSYSLN